MKKTKNLLFYFNSLLFYIFLIIIFSLISAFYLEEFSTKMLLSSYFATNKMQSNNIFEIVIDDYSIQKYTWPWSMDKYADILEYFSTYSKPLVIGMDVDISYSADPLPTEAGFIKKLGSMKNVVVGFAPETLFNDDDEEILKDFKKKYALDVNIKSSHLETPYNGVEISEINFEDPAANYGSVLVTTSVNSGSVFDYGNIVAIKDAYYPSLALKMYLIANNTNSVVIDNNNIIIEKTGSKIPYYYESGLFKNNIRFYKPLKNISPYSHQKISAVKVLQTFYALQSGITPQNHPELYDPQKGRYLDPKFFNDKIILIGANISGPSADVLKTPMSNRHPGVDIQATIYDNISNNHTIIYSSILDGFLISFLLCVISFILIMRLKFLKGVLALILTDLIYLIFVFACAWNGYILAYATTYVCQFVTSVFAYSFKFIIENRNKEQIKSAMGKYLSKDIMQNVVKNIDDLKLGGKRAVVTVLFSDIRGFTSMSEKMSAEEVSAILNEYFAEMEPIISKYNGVINKFIGDAIMAIFGEPIQDENHPQNAVKCAYEMLRRVQYLKDKWVSEGKPKFEIGVGINTGEVFIGNIGTETRMEYTVIGDTVNLASRIEGYNKVYKTNLLVSSSTYSYISDIADVIKIKEVQIRGKSKKMDIYEILRIVKQ